MKISLAQIRSGPDWRKNLRLTGQLIRKAARRSAEAVLFPENTFYMGDQKRIPAVARTLHREKLIRDIQILAKENRIAVLIGGYPEISRGKIYNTSVFIDASGKILARYRKIHLFDVITPHGKRYSESAVFTPGKKPVTFRWRGIRIGMTICYDLRFPEQYRLLSGKGAEWLLVPSAFTAETGKAHWHTLLRARAIENLAVVLAPAQTGTHSTGRKTFGHSLAIGPWGEIWADAGRSPTLIYVDIPVRETAQYRRKFPVLLNP